MEGKYVINRFYTTLPYMHRFYDKMARKDGMKATSSKEFWGWRERTKARLWCMLGLDRMSTADLKPIVEERIWIEDDILREKVIIQTEPSIWMPFYIFIPRECMGSKEAKVFIAPCGHKGGGKAAVAGDRTSPVISEVIDTYNYDYGLQMAQKGYVTICPDARGMGERRCGSIQTENELTDSSCVQLSHIAEPLGMTVAGMFTWDLVRLIDYLFDRGEWNLDDIGCIGFAGGGMQCLWLAALDDRIKKAIISGYMYGVKDSFLEMNQNCSCNYIPHMWESYDYGDIGALIAPGKLVIQSCKDDERNGARGVVNAVEQVNIIKDAYTLVGEGDNVMHDICEGGHKWCKERLDTYLEFLEN